MRAARALRRCARALRRATEIVACDKPLVAFGMGPLPASHKSITRVVSAPLGPASQGSVDALVTEDEDWRHAVGFFDHGHADTV